MNFRGPTLAIGPERPSTLLVEAGPNMVVTKICVVHMFETFIIIRLFYAALFETFKKSKILKEYHI